MTFSRYFRPFVPGFRVRPQNDLPGFNLYENSFPRAEAWRDAMPLGAQSGRYLDTTPALMQQIFRSSAPNPQLFAQSIPAAGLAGFRTTTQDDIPGFKLRLEDAMPRFNLTENESGVQRQETTGFDGTRPELQPPTWLYQLLTMPVPQLSTAFDPQTGRRIVPYPPLINARGTNPTISQNDHMTGSTHAYVEEPSAPSDLSSVSAPGDEEWESPDADQWPPSDTEEWPSSDAEEWPSSDEEWPSDTNGPSQAPSTAASRAPSPQQTVQQATWETHPPRMMDSPVYSEGGGNKNLEDPRGVSAARLPSGIAAPSVRPITDNNFILANARDDAMRQHASANGGSYFGQGSVYRIGLNDARPRRDVPASNGIRNSVIASFGSLAASANTAHQSYGTNSAYPTPFEYRGQPFNAEGNGSYSRRNAPVHLTDLSGTNTQGTTSSSASMSDAYPEPLIPGAQYAQVIQQNNAILRNPRIDRTTERLLSILTETVESLGAGSGPIFGIQAHFEFAKRVKALNIPGIREKGVEQSFDLGRIVRYGLDGSVRTDIVLRDRSGMPIAIYDLKTGNAKLTPSRVQELRNAVGRQDIPVIELRYVSESAILR
jgi:hypothetical protein